ncbi:MAG: phosphoglycerate kinase [Parcubacteria group bacterium RIFOXYD2_FULL_52_8]|nr:MAG: phosphoglycerate kinase [Parcubacteria group bacterium RIFOXYD2_FULL_52_8]
MDAPFLLDPSLLVGKRVLLRLDLNAPIADGKITNSIKLRRIQPTIAMLRAAGARLVVVSHHGGSKDTQSLAPVAEALGLELVPLVFGEALTARVHALANGEAILLENLRVDEREKQNDPTFAADLAALADAYINDAFAESHRKYASIVGIPPLLPSMLGPLFKEEIANLSLAFTPAHPFLVILGGAKFLTKVPLVEQFLASAERIVVTGALSNTFFQAKGYEVGTSLVDAGLDLMSYLAHPKVLLPVDVTVQSVRGSMVKKPDQVLPDENMLDVGPETIRMITALIGEAKLVLWNGPLGNFEKGFSASTDQVAIAVAHAEAASLVGGGDTLVSLERLGLDTKSRAEGGFTFVSTGGGAMLDFLAHHTLPGIEAVQNGIRM